VFITAFCCVDQFAGIVAVVTTEAVSMTIIPLIWGQAYIPQAPPANPVPIVPTDLMLKQAEFVLPSGMQALHDHGSIKEQANSLTAFPEL